jgi:Cysteine-rich CPCC
VSAFPLRTVMVVSVDSDPAQRPIRRGPGDEPSPHARGLIRRREAWFDAYISQRNVFAAPGPEPCTCPCCGHTTLSERGAYEICGECGWEDDGQDDHDSAVIRGGPNGPLSLDAARAAYERRGRTRGIHVPPSAPR